MWLGKWCEHAYYFFTKHCRVISHGFTGLYCTLSITTQARFKCVVQKWGIPLANCHGRLVNLPVGKLRVIVEFAPMKGLSIFGFIGLRRMNRTCDFWVAILWMYFKRIQQWGLIIVPQVRILLFFETWWLRKKCHLAFSSLSIEKHFAHKRQR
jgi:hypothetical protein